MKGKNRNIWRNSGEKKKKMQGKLRKIEKKFGKNSQNSDFFGSNYGFFC